MIVGIVIGPHGPLPVVNHVVLKKLDLFTNLTLGAVMFLIGERLLIVDLRKYGKQIVYLVTGQVITTSLLVGFTTRMAGASLSLAVILGIIATETGALTVAAICSKERQGAEKAASYLMSAVGVTNVVTAFIFGIAYPLLLTFSGRVVGSGEVALIFIKIAGASFGIGICVGIMLVFATRYFDNQGELLIAQIIALLLVVGVSSLIGSSVVISMLVAGLVSVNLAPSRAGKLFASLKVLESPMYLIFFLIAGADFNAHLLLSAGEIGGVYFLARTLGKIIGAMASIFSKTISFKESFGYGSAMLPHAGLAVGLVAFVVQQSPGLGGRSATIVLASIILFETIGPVFTRRLLRSNRKITPIELTLFSPEYQDSKKFNILLLVDGGIYNYTHLKELFHILNTIGGYLELVVVSNKTSMPTDFISDGGIDRYLFAEGIDEILQSLDMKMNYSVVSITDILTGNIMRIQKVQSDLIVICNSGSIRHQMKYIKSAVERYLAIENASIVLHYDLPISPRTG